MERTYLTEILQTGLRNAGYKLIKHEVHKGHNGLRTYLEKYFVSLESFVFKALI